MTIKILIFLMVLSIVAGIYAILTSWFIHLHMNKIEHLPIGWGNFDTFMREFNKYNCWETKKAWYGSFFGEGSDYWKYEIHADIIKFNGRCMKLDLISYLKFKLWSNKEWRKRNPKQVVEKVIWK